MVAVLLMLAAVWAIFRLAVHDRRLIAPPRSGRPGSSVGVPQRLRLARGAILRSADYAASRPLSRSTFHLPSTKRKCTTLRSGPSAVGNVTRMVALSRLVENEE